MSDRFGEYGASNGRLPLSAVPLKPVVDVAIFWPIGWLEVAGTASSQPTPTAATESAAN